MDRITYWCPRTQVILRAIFQISIAFLLCSRLIAHVLQTYRVFLCCMCSTKGIRKLNYLYFISHILINPFGEMRSQVTVLFCTPSAPQPLEHLPHSPSIQLGAQGSSLHACSSGSLALASHKFESTSSRVMRLVQVTVRVCVPPPHGALHGSNSECVHEYSTGVDLLSDSGMLYS